MTTTVNVTISGPVGSGKSAIAGEIEIALKAIGVPVQWDDEGEKRMTHADWQEALGIYRPSVRIVEIADSEVSSLLKELNFVLSTRLGSEEFLHGPAKAKELFPRNYAALARLQAFIAKAA